MLDLYHASRDDLIRVILAQRDQLADLEQRLARQADELATVRATIVRLTEQIGALLVAGEEAPADDPDGGARPTAMPGLKPTTAAPRLTKARTRRAHGFARRRMAPTHREIHALARCPDCGGRLTGGGVKRTREVIEVPVVPATVTEHVYVERRCPCCRRRWVPAADLAGVVDGQQRLGSGLVSLIATLREEARLPFATIQRYLRTLHGLELSVGALVGAVQRVAARAGPAVEQLRADIRASPVVHADETGWREDGRNGYAWTFSTPTARLFEHGTREKAVLERALGADFAGVLVSDFYVAYTNYDGLHQYCWAHLLRDIHDLVQQHRSDAGVRGWAKAVHRLFARAQTFADPDPAARRMAQRGFEGELAALCAPFLGAAARAEATAAPPEAEVAPPAPQAPLCRRMDKHLAELFVFVADPAVPATNNAAERSLRPLVISRKISGGTRSALGSATKMALASLFGTWRLQGVNPLHCCRQLLAAPQV
jgi:transposase